MSERSENNTILICYIFMLVGVVAIGVAVIGLVIRMLS